MADSTQGRLSAERAIEVTIGLHESNALLLGDGPPALAADIMAALEREGYVVVSRKDQDELWWWRLEFSQRFRPGNLPRVGAALLGVRLRLEEES
jgi:hypothetical protein